MFRLEEPASAAPAEDKGGQDQDGPDTKEKTFLEHAEDAMGEHRTPGQILSQ